MQTKRFLQLMALGIVPLFANCARTYAAPSNQPAPPDVTIARVLVREVQAWEDLPDVWRP